MTAVVAVIPLFLAAVLLLVPGGVLLSICPFGAFLLALVGVLAGLDDHTVRQHDPPRHEPPQPVFQSGYSSFRQARGSAGGAFGVRSSRKL